LGSVVLAALAALISVGLCVKYAVAVWRARSGDSSGAGTYIPVSFHHTSFFVLFVQVSRASLLLFLSAVVS